MSIRPIDYNGMIQRTQDVGTLKHHEDQKPVAEQQAIQTGQLKHEQELAHKISKSEEKENDAYRYDAKEKGNGTYDKNGRKRKNQKKDEQEDGKVILKDHLSGFDIKI